MARGPGIGGLRVGRLRRRDRRHHAQGGAGRAACGAPVGNARHRRARTPHRRRPLEGHRQGQHARRRPRPRRRRLGQPVGHQSSTPATTTAACWRGSPTWSAQGYLSAGYQGDFGRDIERPRNNSSHRALLLPERGLASPHRGVRPARRRPVRRDRPARVLRPLRAGHRPGPLRDRHHRRAASSAPTSAPTTSSSAATRAGALGPARWEMGVDVNGRDGLRALDIIEALQPRRQPLTTTENVSIDSARRIDSAVYASLEAAVAPRLSLAGGVTRSTTWRPELAAATSATARREPRRRVGLPGARRREQLPACQLTAQVARGFRDPVLSDRYFRGPSGRGFITGNPDLDPEIQPAVRRRRALHVAPRARGGLRLPLPHRRSDRALPDDHRRLLLPQPRPGPAARRRGRDRRSICRGGCRWRAASRRRAAARSIPTPISTASPPRPARSRRGG